MKLSRDHLKEIVKECLVEILSEGMGSARLKESFSKKRIVQPSNSALDQPAFPRKSAHDDVLNKKRLSEVIKAEAKGDPILASILADTASTTLPNMLMSEGNKQMPVPVGSVEHVVASHAPEDLFGDEAASKWATLAFMDSPKKF
jgi:hypothetical protein